MTTIKAKVQTNQSQITAKKLAIGQFSLAMSDITNLPPLLSSDIALSILTVKVLLMLISVYISN